MALFKCKICGGTLEIDGAQSVATCEYCGTKQTLPKLDDERKANLYDRANHFRRNNDFDKAMSIYEQILNEDPTDAESYWSVLLCRYGIEYVEDPATHKRVPTVNRAQFTSIFDDEDYKSALQYADGYQCEIYESEAAAINEIQKGILAISQKEEPFDVFICYKETDGGGRRTQDSVLATELYQELTREGFKVFFSRITLEDKLGQEYEPYIFAALNSAKVMVVLGTKPEYFNAVWVKNEWSRFLALIKNGAKKTLIPAYRDMDPYDLPEEFSHLQAQDMSKLGFMQDLIRGIKKIVEADSPKTTVRETVVSPAATSNIAPLLKRAFMFLEDGEFERADDLCEQVLNQDPENAQAYLGKLMVDLRIKKQDELANCAEPFDDNKNYQKAIRFADAELVAELNGYIVSVKERNALEAEEARKESIYRDAECLASLKYLEFLLLDNDTFSVTKKNNTNPKELHIPSTYLGKPVTDIDKMAFRGCSDLMSVTISNGVTIIGSSAFNGCTSLTSITIPDSVTSIGNYAFFDCSSLTSITIPDSVTSIGTSAFYGCSGLTSISIHDSMTTIGEYSFDDCCNLKSINFDGTMAQWNEISKGYHWNFHTGTYTIYCTDGNISK